MDGGRNQTYEGTLCSGHRGPYSRFSIGMNRPVILNPSSFIYINILTVAHVKTTAEITFSIPYKATRNLAQKLWP